MKKYLITLFFLCYTAPLTVNAETFLRPENSFQVAKAYKLGRESKHSLNYQTITTSIVKDCSSRCANCDKTNGFCSRCETGYRLKNNICVACPSNAVCNGTGSFTCARGYKLNAAGTDCEKDLIACGNSQVFNPVVNACVNAVCPMHCAIDCMEVGGYCSACESGYYLDSRGLCPACPTNCATCSGPYGICTSCVAGTHLKNGACIGHCENVTCVAGAKKVANNTSCCCVKETATIANCVTQNGTTCSKCNSGYYLKNNTCVTCPANATCSGTSVFACNSGFYKSNDRCLSCSLAIDGCLTCSSSSSCQSCNSNYTYKNGTCIHECDYWDMSATSCSRGYRKPENGGSCQACPADTQCPTCPTGCSGNTAGSCATRSGTCAQCALDKEVGNCSCGPGYSLAMDGQTCISNSGIGAIMQCALR